MDEDLEEDMDAALAEIIDPNDVFPDDDQGQDEVQDAHGQDERQIHVFRVIAAERTLRLRIHVSFRAWRDTYCELDLDTRFEIHLKQGVFGVV